MRERERERERERARESERARERESEKETETKTEAERHTDRHIERQTNLRERNLYLNKVVPSVTNLTPLHKRRVTIYKLISSKRLQLNYTRFTACKLLG